MFFFLPPYLKSSSEPLFDPSRNFFIVSNNSGLASFVPLFKILSKGSIEGSLEVFKMLGISSFKRGLYGLSKYL